MTTKLADWAPGPARDGRCAVKVNVRVVRERLFMVKIHIAAAASRQNSVFFMGVAKRSSVARLILLRFLFALGGASDALFHVDGAVVRGCALTQ